MKQYNYICENGHDNYYSEKEDPPVSCGVCSVAFEEDRIVAIQIEENKEITGLTLIYQINQQRLEVPASNKVILGRESFGAEIFTKIIYNGRPVISRNHCSIDLIGNIFYLKDENSTNGTFIYSGCNKISCQESAQVIENNSILFLGEEAFLAQINYKEEEDSNNETIEVKPSEANLTRFKCKKCGTYSDQKIRKCPNCGFINMYVPAM